MAYRSIQKMNTYPVQSKDPADIIAELENLGRKKFYVMCSGGKDSVSLAHYMAEMGKLDGVFHIQTNIGIQKTTDFVKDLCQEQGWKLFVREPSPKFLYASLVLEAGFPSAGAHHIIMRYLKYMPMRKFAFEAERKKDHVMISGVRKFESQRRMGNYDDPISRDGNLWFGMPFFWKTSEELYRYIHENGLRITPVHETMGFSGECECGSFASFNEKMRIRDVDPKLAAYIEWLEEGVKKFGSKKARRFSNWGNTTSMTDLEKQQFLDQFVGEDIEGAEQIICGSECGPSTMKGMTDF